MLKTTLDFVLIITETTLDSVENKIDMPSLLKDAMVQDTLGHDCRFSLLSLPMYMVGQLKRLLREMK